MGKPFRVIDTRNKQYFVVDDLYLNGFAKHLGVTASMIYISLCRHCSKTQEAFPSQKLIAEELGIKERTVMSKIKKLKEYELIDIKRTKNEKGVWMNNTYVLLDKSIWRKDPPTEKQQVESTYSLTAKPPTEKLYIKDTHKKDTHTLSIGDVGEKDFEEISNKYQVPMSFVRSKYDDMVLWAGERPGNSKLRGRNWRLTLMKWVKTDSFKLKTQQKRGGMIHVESQTN